LLFNRLHTHRAHVGSTGGFKRGSGIGGIGLVTPHVGAHVLGGQKTHFNGQAIEPACPMVGRAAGFHDDQANGSVGKPALELGAAEALGFNDAPVLVGHGQLEDGLCQINGDGCSIHLGLLSFG
jgi:hypothetical protein